MVHTPLKILTEQSICKIYAKLRLVGEYDVIVTGYGNNSSQRL